MAVTKAQLLEHALNLPSLSAPLRLWHYFCQPGKFRYRVLYSASYLLDNVILGSMYANMNKSLLDSEVWVRRL